MSPPLHSSEAHCCIANQVMCITRFLFFFHIARQYCYYWVVIVAYVGTWKKVGFLLSLSTSQRWGWWTSWAWPSNALLWKEDSTALWTVLGWASPTGEGWWSSPSTQHWLDPSGVLYLVLGSPADTLGCGISLYMEILKSRLNWARS